MCAIEGDNFVRQPAMTECLLEYCVYFSLLLAAVEHVLITVNYI